MKTKLITCPACKGKKIVEKVSTEGKICCYGDRSTIKEPCKVCNGTGIVTQEKWDTWNGENK